MAKKKTKGPRVTARDWGIVTLIQRSGGKGAHKSKKRQARSTAKAAHKKSLMRNDSHEAFFMSFFSGVLPKDQRSVDDHVLLSSACLSKASQLKLFVFGKTIFH